MPLPAPGLWTLPWHSFQARGPCARCSRAVSLPVPPLRRLRLSLSSLTRVRAAPLSGEPGRTRNGTLSSRNRTYGSQNSKPCLGNPDSTRPVTPIGRSRRSRRVISRSNSLHSPQLTARSEPLLEVRSEVLTLRERERGGRRQTLRAASAPKSEVCRHVPKRRRRGGGGPGGRLRSDFLRARFRAFRMPTLPGRTSLQSPKSDRQ